MSAKPEKPFSEVVIPLVREVGELVSPYFGNPGIIKNKSDSAADAVTELDKQAERLYAERLHDAYPSIGFYGEEFGGDTDSERYWLVDPIDGTGHFIRGLPFCSTMISLIQENQPVFAVIYSFIQKDLYVAERGKGATKNGTKIHVSDRSLKRAYIFHEINFNHRKNIATFLELEQHAILVETISAGFEHAQVADGKMDGRICLNAFGKNYDYAPGSLLVEEAGGIVRNIGSDTYDFNNHSFIAANSRVYQDLRNLGVV
ncbi:MAG: inositol monophosphatase family protein [bacterium]|nr:inositol monophosphatase family protein [bacterium]